MAADNRYRHGGGKGPHPIKVRCSRCFAVLGFRKAGGVGTWACLSCRIDMIVDADLVKHETAAVEGAEGDEPCSPST